jgi:hypothetical protein
VTVPKLKYSHDNELDAALVEALDWRDGPWTQLERIDMDMAFCAAMRRAHPELLTKFEQHPRRSGHQRGTPSYSAPPSRSTAGIQ